MSDAIMFALKFGLESARLTGQRDRMAIYQRLMDKLIQIPSISHYVAMLERMTHSADLHEVGIANAMLKIISGLNDL